MINARRPRFVPPSTATRIEQWTNPETYVGRSWIEYTNAYVHLSWLKTK